MKKTLALVAALSIGATSALSAQTTGTVKFLNGGSIDDGHYYVGPYNGQLNGNNIVLNCVDFFHEVTNGEVWTVNITQSSALGTSADYSRHADPSGTSPAPNTAQEIKDYEEAAWLVGQYAGASTANVIQIQHAIWQIFGGDVGADSGNWLTLAANNYTSAGSFELLTATNPNDPSSAQEFLVTTPEPTSIALLGTGLVGLVPMFRRRRNNV